MKSVEAVIAQKYDLRFSRFGAVPEASLWFSEDRQIMRFKLIADVLDKKRNKKGFSINDIGCGYGALLPYLFKRFPNVDFVYRGFDIAEKPINFCNKTYGWKNVTFRIRNLPDKESDFSVMSGTYNYAPVVSVNVWQDYLFKNLTQIWKSSQLAFIPNRRVLTESSRNPSNDCSDIQRGVVAQPRTMNERAISRSHSTEVRFLASGGWYWLQCAWSPHDNSGPHT